MSRTIALVALAVAATGVNGAPAGQRAAFAPSLSLRTSGVPASSCSSFVGCKTGTLSQSPSAPRHASTRAARLQSATPVMMAGLYDNEETPKATKELLQVRFAKMTAEALRAWIIKWPSGTIKDKFGLPKLMLPVSTEANPKGLKIIFKGSLDPWLQVELEGDTVRVFRCSGLSTTSLSVSALKQREEMKICDKLKEDLKLFGDMVEREIPVVKPVEEPAAEEEAAEATTEEPAAPAPPPA